MRYGPRCLLRCNGRVMAHNSSSTCPLLLLLLPPYIQHTRLSALPTNHHCTHTLLQNPPQKSDTCTNVAPDSRYTCEQQVSMLDRRTDCCGLGMMLSTNVCHSLLSCSPSLLLIMLLSCPYPRSLLCRKALVLATSRL